MKTYQKGQSDNDLMSMPIEVGGRNYIYNSNVTISSEKHLFENYISKNANYFRGKTVTLSVDVELLNAVEQGNNRIGFEVSITYNDGTNQYLRCWHHLKDGNSVKKRISNSYTIYDKEIIGLNAGIHVQIGGEVTSVGKPKLELGTIPTDWTPAPEDIEARLKALEEKVGL